MKRVLAAAALLLAAVLLQNATQIAPAAGPGDWPMFGHDPAHTGYNADETQIKPPLRLKWSYTIGDRVYSSTVADGVVYMEHFHADREGGSHTTGAAERPAVFGITGTDSYAALSAVTSDTGEQVTSFQQPVAVTLSYDAARLTVPENVLTIQYYDDTLRQWVSLPSLVDTVNHTVSAQTTHFTVFGVLANLPWRGYLPLIPQSYESGW